MPTNQASQVIRKSVGISHLNTIVISTLILLHTVGVQAEEREVTIAESGITSTHHYTAPIVADSITGNQIRQPTALRQINSHNDNFWINQASIQLNNDHDLDGHYSSFTLTIDVDTLLVAPAVYAVLYLSLQDNNWIEYAVSNNFIVQGSGTYDAYTIDTNLDSGYPSGYYDQYIELYDAHSHELLIGYGPADSYSLQGLPIESSLHDNRFLLSNDLTLSLSGTGTFGLPLLLLLVSTLSYRRRATNQKTPTK